MATLEPNHRPDPLTNASSSPTEPPVNASSTSFRGHLVRTVAATGEFFVRMGSAIAEAFAHLAAQFSPNQARIEPEIPTQSPRMPPPPPPRIQETRTVGQTAESPQTEQSPHVAVNPTTTNATAAPQMPPAAPAKVEKTLYEQEIEKIDANFLWALKDSGWGQREGENIQKPIQHPGHPPLRNPDPSQTEIENSWKELDAHTSDREEVVQQFNDLWQSANVQKRVDIILTALKPDMKYAGKNDYTRANIAMDKFIELGHSGNLKDQRTRGAIFDNLFETRYRPELNNFLSALVSKIIVSEAHEDQNVYALKKMYTDLHKFRKSSPGLG